MNFYKFDYKGPIGVQVITVPTDSVNFIGIKHREEMDSYSITDGKHTTESSFSLNGYELFRLETDSEPSVKEYTVVITGKGQIIRYQIRVIVVESSLSPINEFLAPLIEGMLKQKRNANVD